VGLPTVATRVGGVPEILGPELGVVVEPGSSKALADGLRDILSRLDNYDPNALRARAIGEFGYDAIGNRWTDVYAAASTPGSAR
jgi:glycosyltransferase involved in cell wall biosynthesis